MRQCQRKLACAGQSGFVASGHDKTGPIRCCQTILTVLWIVLNFDEYNTKPKYSLGIYQPHNLKTKKSLLNSPLIPKNRENPPSPNDLLSKDWILAEIKALVEASNKTAVCIMLKPRSNSGYFGQLCYLGKQMADRQSPVPLSVKVR